MIRARRPTGRSRFLRPRLHGQALRGRGIRHEARRDQRRDRDRLRLPRHHVTGQRGGEKKSFEAVRAEIEEEVRKQLAQAKFSEAAEQFSNLVYEQADSLQPAADKLKLTSRRQ